MSAQIEFTEGQRLYLEEVLGASASQFRLGGEPVASEESANVEIVVLTPRNLSTEASELLAKILGSIQLQNYVRQEADSSDQIVDAKHVLSFFGDDVNPRRALERSVWWSFHRLEEMLPGASNMNAVKKLTWATLQQFRGELGR